MYGGREGRASHCSVDLAEAKVEMTRGGGAFPREGVVLLLVRKCGVDD